MIKCWIGFRAQLGCKHKHEHFNCSKDEMTEIEEKFVISDIKTSGMDSDDEPSVEHLSPQTLLETPDADVQYSLKSDDGKTNLKVLFYILL